MKSLAMLATAALLAGLASFGVACSSSSSALTLEEYFQKIDEIQNDNDATFATQEASRADPAADASGEELAAFFSDNVTSSADVLRDTAAKADDLEAPDEVAADHDDIVAALNASVAALDDMADSIPDSMTTTELEQAFNSDALNAAFDDLATACNALEAIATANNITVDLACDEG
jgi:hypothetical protein